MKEFWSKKIRDAEPYVPGEQPKDRKFIKLNTNENPYPPAQSVIAAIHAAADEKLRLYPDPECLDLRRAIARHTGLREEQVFCGNGSDEILAFAFQAFFDPNVPVSFADVTYSFYEVWAKYLDLSVSLIPLNDDFSLPLERFLEEPKGGIVIANPNAPTGQALAAGEVKRVVEAHPDQVVIVDEAYVDFGAESMARYIDTYPNLLVVQTASKSRSLAGLRVGWAMGNENLMAALRCVRDSVNSYTVDRLAAAGTAAALDNEEYFEKTCAAIAATRDKTRQRLLDSGFAVLPSKANFLFVSHPGVPGKALFQGLRERGVLARWFDKPRIRDHLRITVGTDEEMDALVAALNETVKTLK